MELDTYNDGLVESEVVVSELTGAEVMLYSKIDDLEFVSRVDARHQFQPGDKVKLAFNINKGHFFDQTEQAIR